MSWSSIEWNCEWKLLHYAAVRFYSPVLLSMYEEGYEVKIWMTSDEHKHITGELAIQLVLFKDGFVQKEWSVPVDIGSNKSAQIFTIDTQELFGTKLPYYEYISENPIGRTKSFLQAKFNPRDITVNGGAEISNLLFFVPLKSVALQDATIATKWIVQEGDVWELEVSSNEVAPFVYLRFEAEHDQKGHYNDIPRCAGRFADNGFLLHKNEKKKIKFFRFDDAKRDLKLLASSLSATYL
jgi:beta-mannosidase